MCVCTHACVCTLAFGRYMCSVYALLRQSHPKAELAVLLLVWNLTDTSSPVCPYQCPYSCPCDHAHWSVVCFWALNARSHGLTECSWALCSLSASKRYFKVAVKLCVHTRFYLGVCHWENRRCSQFKTWETCSALTFALCGITPKRLNVLLLLHDQAILKEKTV